MVTSTGFCSDSQMLEPASATVPAAAKNKHNEKYDDEKCRVVHVGLLRFESDG